MKKTGLVLLVVLVAFLGRLGSQYNTLVTLDEQVNTAAAQVQNQYQRRVDLIPNLVNVVKGFAAQESGVLVAVTQARASATQLQLNVNDAQSLAQYQQAQQGISAALGRLLAVSEAYPELKSNQNFLELQAQLEGTENRIATERGRYNEVVQGYNITVRRFPMGLVAGFLGFTAKAPFAADEAAQEAPVVDFGAN